MPAASYLYLSSLGTGTYLGNADDSTDEQVLTALLYAVTRGWNVLDTGRVYVAVAAGAGQEQAVGAVVGHGCAGHTCHLTRLW